MDLVLEQNLLDGYVIDSKNYSCPVPIDFHALRILWANRIIDFNKKATVPFREKHPDAIVGKRGVRVCEKLMDTIALWSYQFISDNGFSFIAINPAIWVLSRDLCKRMRQNQTKDDGKVIFDIKTLLANSNYWPKNYLNPCSFCPIAKYCTGAIPSNPYYRFGYLMRLEKIQHPQVSMDFLPDLSLNNKRQRGNGTWSYDVQKINKKRKEGVINNQINMFK